jgi:hypothetical protein
MVILLIVLEKNCSVCYKEFICEGDENCWCMNIKVLEPKDFDSNKDCLCPDCLKSIAVVRSSLKIETNKTA